MNIYDYLIANKQLFLSPIILIISFLYLFINKSIKYNIVFSYIGTILIMLISLGFIKYSDFTFPMYQLLNNYILFFGIYMVTDYGVSPTNGEGQIIYGIIIGILSVLFITFIPKIGTIISIIIGSLLLTNITEKYSFKLKYNHKFYNTIIFSSISLLIITTILLIVI